MIANIYNLTGLTNFAMTLQPNAGISGNVADLNVFTPGFNNRNAFSFINSTNDWWMQYGDGWIRSRRSSTGAEALLTLQHGHTSQGLSVFTAGATNGAFVVAPTTDDERIQVTGTRIDGYQNSNTGVRSSVEINLGSTATIQKLILGNSAGPTLSVGTGVPSAAEPNSSVYFRTDGTGPNLYVRENGIWVAK